MEEPEERVRTDLLNFIGDVFVTYGSEMQDGHGSGVQLRKWDIRMVCGT